MVSNEKIILIDTDAGLDDTLAIIMAVKAHLHPDIPFHVIGITCVHGNTTLENVTSNVTTTLETLKVNNIPIYRGAAHPMVTPSQFHSKARHHGGNGFGDLDEQLLKRLPPKLETENATSAIIRFANEYAGKLTIVAMGPLTNLALAARADDRITDKVKEIFIMGGSAEGRGSCSPCAEFNFLCDPESVHVTLTAFSCPISIAPIELGRKVVPQTWMAGYVMRVQANKKVLAEQEIYNVYIRLQRCADSLNEYHYFITVGGYLLDDIQLSRYGANEQIMRQLGRRLARNLGLNYFDYEDISAKHLIYHYKGYSRRLWQRADLASLFAVPWEYDVEEEKELQENRALRKRVMDREAREEAKRRSTIFHDLRRGSETGVPGRRRSSIMENIKPRHPQ